MSLPSTPRAELRAIEQELAASPDLSPAERALHHRDAVYLALDLGDAGAAMTHALNCLDLARACGDKTLQVKAHVALALVQAHSYDDLGADTQFQVADTLARAAHDDRGVALVAVNVSHYELERRNYPGAVSPLLTLLDSPHARGLERPDARNLLESFHINLVVGTSEALLAGTLPLPQRDAATRQLGRSADFLREWNAGRTARISPVDASNVLDALTRHALWGGDLASARALADEHVHLAGQADLPLLYGRALLDRSRVQAHVNEWDGAIRDAEQAVQAFGTVASGLWEARARQALADTYARVGRFEDAFETQRAVTHGVERLYRDYHQQRALVGQIEQQAREAEVRALALAEAALRDPLTGAPNRTHAMQTLSELHERALRGQPSAIALMDLDHFKRVNDTYGHVVGDTVLIEVARSLTAELRDEDLLARLGGEEFLVIVTDVGVDEAMSVCERLRDVLARTDWSPVAGGLRTTGSFGVAALDGRQDVTATLKAADKALYAAKHAGRNTVHLAPLPVLDGA